MLYDLELNDTLTRLDDKPPADPETDWTQSLTRQEQLIEKEWNALNNILSPAQLDNFRALQADKLQQMKQLVKRQIEQRQRSRGSDSPPH